MNKCKRKSGFCFIAIALLLSLLSTKVYAENSPTGFSVEALNKNGESVQQGFYHYEGLPGESEEARIRIYNSSSSPIVVDIEVNAASTNQNGVPSYSKSENLDKTLKHPLDTLVELDQNSLTIEPESSKEVRAIIHYPQNEWDGQILGGFRFTQRQEEKKTEAISHEISYTVGVLMNLIDGEQVENDLKLNDINSGQRNFRNFIEANLQNTAPVMIKNLSIDASIYQENDTEAIYKYNVQDLRMAPNSNFDLGIPTGDIPLQAGNYTIEMSILADGKAYNFEKEFQINSDQAKRLNSSAVNLTTERSYLIYVIFSGVIIALIILLILKYKKERKED